MSRNSYKTTSTYVRVLMRGISHLQTTKNKYFELSDKLIPVDKRELATQECDQGAKRQIVVK